MPAVRSAAVVDTIKGRHESVVAARGFLIELSIVLNAPNGVVDIVGTEIETGGDITVVGTKNNGELERSTTTIHIDEIEGITSVFGTSGDLEFANPVVVFGRAPNILQKIAITVGEASVGGKGGVHSVLRLGSSDINLDGDGLNSGVGGEGVEEMLPVSGGKCATRVGRRDNAE